MGTADGTFGTGALESVGGEVIELAILFKSSGPIRDVRLIPYFPQPCCNFFSTIPFDRVLNPLINELPPSIIILWRVGPTGPQVSTPAPGVCIRFGFR